MTEKIQKVPLGLNELLRIQQSQVAPDQLADTFIGVVDATDFFGALNYTTSLVQTALLGAVAGVATNTVPAGETWRVLGVGVEFDTFSLVGATVRGVMQIQPIGQSFGLPIFQIGQPTDVAIGTVNDFVSDGVWLGQPMIALPGTTFRWLVTKASAAGTYRVGVKVLYQLLKY